MFKITSASLSVDSPPSGDFVEVQVSEATTPQINWLVAKIMGSTRLPNGHITWPLDLTQAVSPSCWFPATNWSQGGPIIEKEFISLIRTPLSGHWSAYWTKDTTEGAVETKQDGPTALIAALRCFIAYTLGEVVEVPKELA
jgi:hypothetical protein